MKSARSAANGVVPKNTPSVLDIAPRRANKMCRYCEELDVLEPLTV